MTCKRSIPISLYATQHTDRETSIAQGIDARIVNEVRNPNLVTVVGTSTRRGIIDQISSVGGHATYNSTRAPRDSDGDGIPDMWELLYGLDPNDPTDGAKTTLSGGTYTNLEVYLV